MTDFLAELEQQMTEAAHRAVAERARPRVRLWPTVALVATAAVAIGAMFLLPERNGTAPPAKQPFVSLRGTSIGIYNTAGFEGMATTAAQAIRRLGPSADVGNLPASRRASIVLADSAHAAQARKVARALGIERFGTARELPGGTIYDVTVLLGDDYAKPAPKLLSAFAFLRESPNEQIFTTSGRVRVIATRAGLCLQVHAGAGRTATCADVTDALAGKLVIADRARNGRLRGALGMVPDWIDGVEVDDGTRRLPVVRNLWSLSTGNATTVKVGSLRLTVP
ncbi:LytR C-terminal domain-containing protein [Solirubrobacter soli]|uniref:LytR C-terminal domain-containing protein n=1 Tax=Solirubrobacter soli TaxID=363832 RepID=UPI00041873A0|nr:LytR C-terminal domain-containing protein [Solirubrobacter soli]